ncbi:hypothetical protein HJB89_10775 [Rhizobium sp. NZLR8]|uniref:hypothetical protein n=1 Tax=Rhizobium sp. NZLR8 TaxID=2731104 RepID=UPI001C82894A|nr:hypothetical protein [Rhizobium sp. NZLR8]MBX5157608.1 hypothetical protein [Rhizobium sp. NZLR8]
MPRSPYYSVKRLLACALAAMSVGQMVLDGFVPTEVLASGTPKKVDVMIVRKGYALLSQSQNCQAGQPCKFEFGNISANILLGQNFYVSVQVSGKQEFCCLFSNRKMTLEKLPTTEPFRADLFRFAPSSKEVKFDRYFGQVFVKVE